MEFLMYIFRFLYRIRFWLILAPLLVVLVVIFATRNMPRTYNVKMTVFTGVVSGFVAESGEGGEKSTSYVNNALDNIISIIMSKETLKDVCIHLYARHMIYGDPEKDNTYIQAKNYRHLKRITPPEVLALIDKDSEERTVENLLNYEKADPKNFVYGLFNWNHPHYCYNALKQLTVKRIGNSDMLEITYSANDPGVAFQTLLLLDKMYVKEYKTLQFGTTNSVIQYFEKELARIGEELRAGEDSLTNFNVRNRIINYNEQTKQVAALDKDFDLIYQDVLLRHYSAKASISYLESQLEENVLHLKNNAQFLSKLKQISTLNSKIADLQTLVGDSTLYSKDHQQLNNYQLQLKNAEKDFREFIESMSLKKYTRDGYPTSNFVTQWLDELLKLEKTKAEIQVMEEHKKNIDEQYSHFSPIGSIIKRQERSIDFTERSYMSILSSLNAARLRLKSLEMNSASLQVINPPTYPLGAEPTKRKQIVLAAFVGSLVFILGVFLLVDVLDRTLRDKIRTERITSGKVLGAFPGRVRRSRQRYMKVYRDKAIKYLSNTLFNHLDTKKTNIISLISTGEKTGKSFLSEQLVNYWESQGLRVLSLQWNRDFNPLSKEFVLAQSVYDLCSNDIQADLILVEYAPLSLQSIPNILLQEASVNLLIAGADKVWKENDQLLFKDVLERGKPVPLYIYLNNAATDVVENFTGFLPPYTSLRRLAYRCYQLGITSSDID